MILINDSVLPSAKIVQSQVLNTKKMMTVGSSCSSNSKNDILKALVDEGVQVNRFPIETDKSPTNSYSGNLNSL